MWASVWLNRGLRLKIFTLFFIIAIVPILAVNTLWSMSAHDQLRQIAKKNQQILLDGSAARIDRYFARKTTALVTYAQDLSASNLSAEQKQFSVLQYARHDQDIVGIALLDSLGHEQVVVVGQKIVKNSNAAVPSLLLDTAKTKTTGASIGEVVYVGGEPRVSFAMPLQKGDASAGAGGVLIVDLRLTDLWQTVLKAPLGKQGYTYIVDGQGKLIAHPDAGFFENQMDLKHVQQVAQFVRQPQNSAINITTVSEKGVKVMSGYKPIPRTGWAIITQEPEVSLYDPVQHVYRVILWVFVATTLFALVLSFFFSRTITRPIKSLVRGASKLSEGNFDAHIPVRSTDEIGLLAERFNTMADNLKRVIYNLQAEDNKLSVVLNSVGEGVVAVDADKRIVFANVSAAILAGGLPTSLEGKHFNEVFKLTKNSHPFQLDLKSTQVYKDIVYTSPNKRLHYLDIFANKIKDDPDGIKNIITLRDQTDERDLEMMKHDFVSMAAHELRTPITAIKGYLGLLADEETSLSDTGKHSVERARSSANELVDLINNLLNVSKIEGGTLDIAYSKIDWIKLLKNAIDNHKFNADEKQISITYEGPDSDVWLMADELAIKEVVNNLIANAIHYTAPDGHITVGVRLEHHRVYTYVKDTGMGMTPNAMRRLFTKFYRVKSGLASGSGGTGLGLFISKSIIELHKGKIWVESEAGKGSIFTFTLPDYNEEQYQELAGNQEQGVSKRRGWTTKNTTR